MLARVILIAALAACHSPRVTPPVLRSSLAARDTVDFTVTGEVGPLGTTGARGVTGSAGPNAVANGLNAGCARLKLRGGAGGADLGCTASGGDEVTFVGSTNGNVPGTEAVVGTSGPFTAEAWAGTAGAVAVLAENQSGVAVKAVGGADFRSATRVGLPLRWIVQSCGDAPNGEPSPGPCECNCVLGNLGCGPNTCTGALAVCDPDEIVISGACRVNGGSHIRNSCPSNNLAALGFCSSTGGERSFYCDSDVAGTIRTYALCMKVMP